jgi:hypothetical protein
MPNDKEPFSNSYDCPKYGKTVTVSGVKVSLRGGPGPFPLTIAAAATSCSGMPPLRL